MTIVDYETQVYCSHCGDVHERTDCKLIPNWGFKCPECGGKCRVKAKYTGKKYPYIRVGRLGRKAIRKEILQLTKLTQKERSRRYYIKHRQYILAYNNNRYREKKLAQRKGLE